MPHANPQPGHTQANQPTQRTRWSTKFVDGGVLEAVLSRDDGAPLPADPVIKVLGRVEDQTLEVRKNVQDAARAVLTWLSQMTHHQGKADLDAVLDRCLRPGPDSQGVNFAALAKEVKEVTGQSFTAKRIQTAVTHLRAAHEKQAAQPAPPTPSMRDALAELDQQVRNHFDQLTLSETKERAALRRAIGTEVLTAVRCAAGRVIDRDFGEGIPCTVDIAALEGRFLGYVRDTLRDTDAFGSETPTLEHDLRQLLITLADHTGNRGAEADMKLVLHGSRVVQSMLGAESLPGVMAQLNVLVAGRDLIDTDLYIAEMLRLAQLAEALHEDADTTRYLNWVRRLPEDRRLPSPIRVSSYCRSNAATRMYDRIHRDELDANALAIADAQQSHTYLQLADETHDRMLERDAGFTLTLTTHFLRHVVDAKVTQDASRLTAWLTELGPAKTLDRLEALIRFENNDDLVAEARAHAEHVWPEVKHQLICVR